MALSPDVVVVAPGELITAQHVNNIRSNLTRLDSDKFDKAGGVITGGTTVQANVNVPGSNWLIVGEDPAPANTANGGVSFNQIGGRLRSWVNSLGVNAPNLQLNRGGASNTADSGATFVLFQRISASVGSITLAASLTGVAYNTSSDPRLKHRDGDAVDAAQMVQELGAAAFAGRWLDPDSGEPHGVGEIMLSSHDVQDVAPWAVTGERDAVDENGGIVAQQVNYPGLVPLLVAALSQALDRIEALEGGTT